MISEALSALPDKVSFSPGNHRYKILLDGTWQYVPGVTTVIGCLNKQKLNDWRVRVQQEADIKTAYQLTFGVQPGFAQYPGLSDFDGFKKWFLQEAGAQYEADRQSEEARTLGTEIHSLIEARLRSKLGETVVLPRVSDHAHAIFLEWEKWEKDVNLTPLAIETRIASFVHKYAGTLDLLAYAEGELVLFDWKSKKASSSHKLWPEQELQSAAYCVAAEECGLGSPKGRIVRIPKDGGRVEAVPVTCDREEAFQVFLGLKAALLWQRQREKA